MTAQELVQRLKDCRASIEAARPAETLRIAFNLLDFARTRIQTGGGNYNNVPFAPYNPNYAKRRKKAGYQADYVDFTRTGRLWANIVPAVTANTPGRTIVVVGARIPAQQDILNYQSTKPGGRPRGNILRPSEKELEAARAANQARLDNHLRKFGLK